MKGDIRQNKELNEKPKRKVKKVIYPYTLDKTDLTCKICGERFPVHQRLQIHMNEHFPNHICETCGRAFSTRAGLLGHRQSHTARQLTCPSCPGRSFKGASSLLNHTKTFHAHLQLHKCRVCGLSFKCFETRRRHLVETHGEEDRKYVCKYCNKGYRQAGVLSKHIRSVHLQERKHACSQCGMSFFRRLGLANHMLKHTGERSHECNICGKKYSRKYTLTEHMKIHTNERKHICNVCGKAFLQKGTLKGHMAIHEREEAFQERGTLHQNVDHVSEC